MKYHIIILALSYIWAVAESQKDEILNPKAVNLKLGPINVAEYIGWGTS